MGEGGPLPLKKARLSDLVGPFCLPFLASVFASCVTAIGYVGAWDHVDMLSSSPRGRCHQGKKEAEEGRGGGGLGSVQEMLLGKEEKEED
jgi:hypothetical protein